MANRPDQSVQSSLITTMKIVSPEHLNPNGSLFGGYLMCWIDEVAYMCARRYSGQPTCATVNIDNISFRAPHLLGEHISLTARVVYVGQTSMEIEVKVEKEEITTESRDKKVPTNTAYLTFVCLNKNGKPIPVPRLRLESEEDKRRYWESQLRIKVRRRLQKFLERKLREGKKVNIDISKNPESLIGAVRTKIFKYIHL